VQKLNPIPNHRITHQRKVIFEELKRVQTHPTADEIYEVVRKRLPRISLGTVYRNLDILSENGLIQKLKPGIPQMRFDGNPREHLHITCSHCGSVEDANIEPSDDILENLENILGKLTKYGVFGHKLELMGFCGSCTKGENIPA
jgi:Fur family ferric uptake transcriptional regulator